MNQHESKTNCKPTKSGCCALGGSTHDDDEEHRGKHDLGYEGITPQLGSLIRQGKFDEMAALITDEMLEQYAVVCRWDQLADRLIERYSGTASRLVMYLAEESIRRDPAAAAKWGDVARAVRAAE